jgi:hypothetical protein
MKLAIVVMSLLGSGCGSQPRVASVRVSAALVTAQVDRLVLTVVGEGPATLPLLEADLSRGPGSTWTASLNNLPAPSRYRFILDALNAQGARIFSGETVANLMAGATTELTIVAQESPPSALSLTLPVVSALTISAVPAVGGGTVTLSIVAQDSGGGPLVYSWQDACGGTFLDPSAASTTWTAPNPAPLSPCPVLARVAEGASSVAIYFPITFL